MTQESAFCNIRYLAQCLPRQNLEILFVESHQLRYEVAVYK